MDKKIEKLPDQLEGRGYIIRPSFQNPQKKILAHLVDTQLFGFTTSLVVERIMSIWLLNNNDGLSHLSCTQKEAQELGYFPIKFKEREPAKYCRVHQRMPLKVEVYGLPAYQVDKLTEFGLYGQTRKEVLENIVRDWIFGDIERLSLSGCALKKKSKNALLSKI